MEADLVLSQNLVIKGAELGISVSRASGPGGQHVNKTSSRVSLRFNIIESQSLTDIQKARLLEKLATRLVGEGELLIHVDSERSQFKNRQIARERLKEIIRKALLPRKKRVATKPTLGSKQQRISSKKKRGLLKKLRRLNDS